MSLSHETLLELMSLADGELEGDAKVRAEKLVAESDEARRAVQAFRAPHVGMWLTETLDRQAVGAGADRIADAVMGKLSGERERGGVVARIGDSSPRAPARRRTVGAVIVVVTALAAGVALFIKSSERSSGDRSPVASVGMPSVDMQGPPPAQAPPGSGVEVDEVDSPSRGISVFEIPLHDLGGASASAGARSASSVVIWIDDEGAK